jgi:hypothetical protein
MRGNRENTHGFNKIRWWRFGGSAENGVSYRQMFTRSTRTRSLTVSGTTFRGARETFADAIAEGYPGCRLCGSGSFRRSGGHVTTPRQCEPSATFRAPDPRDVTTMPPEKATDAHHQHGRRSGVGIIPELV